MTHNSLMTNVKGKWVLVTGASRGLGKLSALLLADYGCNLILHSRDKSHCENFAKELETKGVKTFCVQAELDKLAIFADDKKSGRIFRAQEYAGKKLKDIL